MDFKLWEHIEWSRALSGARTQITAPALTQRCSIFGHLFPPRTMELIIEPSHRVVMRVREAGVCKVLGTGPGT